MSSGKSGYGQLSQNTALLNECPHINATPNNQISRFVSPQSRLQRLHSPSKILNTVVEP